MRVVTHGVKQVALHNWNTWVRTVTRGFTVMHVVVNGVTQKARLSYMWVTELAAVKQGLT